MRFTDKIAIITGAASGIGAATAKRFAAEGALVVMIDLETATLPDGNHLAIACDISDETAVQNCVARIVNKYARIDILCNNAGVVCNAAPITDIDSNDWQKVMGVNLFGCAHFIKHVGRVMVQQNAGAIVNTASVAGIRSGAGGNIYSASKAAVINLTKTSACDLGKYGIRVNAVCPGLIETGMTRQVFDYARDKGITERLGERCELRRYGNPSEIAAAITFLASDDASYITGQALAVDGGNTASLNLPGMKY